ncbi:MAG: PRC-barrel domain-containing protein [Pseudomonadota bacterium]
MIARPTLILALVLTVTAPAAAAAPEPHEFAEPEDVTAARELVGTTVITREGAHLGTVHDYAIDLDSGRVAYVVLSVGSFLIDDNLIAVDPRALRPSGNEALVLAARQQDVKTAQRFAADRWPLRADVPAAPGRGAVAAAGEDAAQDQNGATDADATPGGSATISDGTRTATLSAGERSLRIESPEPSEPPPAAERAEADPEPFDRLDENGDGHLDRAEIAHELGRDDRYSAIDRDRDGTVSPEEFAAWRGNG